MRSIIGNYLNVIIYFIIFMGLLIRESTHEDISSILDLLYDLDRPRPLDGDETKIFENKISDYFLDSQKNIIVAEQNKEIVGVVGRIPRRKRLSLTPPWRQASSTSCPRSK